MELQNQDTWRFINTFAPWLSAIGTIAAVFLSLYLARQDRKIFLKVSAGHRIIVGHGVEKPYPEYLSICVVNIGHRDAQIINIGWKAGIIRKRYAIQTTINDGMSSDMPVRLRDGDEARYYIPLDKKPDWLEKFRKDMLHPFPRLQVLFLKVQAFTSGGEIFESKIENSLKKKILAES
jgi:hypothetical protein